MAPTANEMHPALRAPTKWYMARRRWHMEPPPILAITKQSGGRQPAWSPSEGPNRKGQASLKTNRASINALLIVVMYLNLQNGQNNGPHTAYTLYFGILSKYFGLFWRSRYWKSPFNQALRTGPMRMTTSTPKPATVASSATSPEEIQQSPEHYKQTHQH